jgi:hypothetical protein
MPSQSVYDAIATVAQQNGVPVEVALATAYHESGLNPFSEGDRGYFSSSGYFTPSASGPPTSFGLYQLHKGGELGNLSQGAAENAFTNASVAIPHFAHVRKEHPDWTWGQVVAHAQGPANPGAYAATIDSILSNYRASHMKPQSFFDKLTHGAASKDAGANATGPSTYGPAGGLGPNAPATPAAGSSTPDPVDDWVAAIDKALNPKLDHGLNLLGDTAGALQLVTVRAGVALVGLILVGTGLLVVFGKEIFGGAMLAVPGVGEAAGAVEAVTSVTKARHAATVANRKARGAAAVTREAT